MPKIIPRYPRQIVFYGTNSLYQRILDQAAREQLNASTWLRLLVNARLRRVEPAGNEPSRSNGDRPASS
jgi:hypothetical protein